MTAITSALDAPGFNFTALPKDAQVCGYTTGSGGVKWTDAMWKTFPSAVRICQDALASDRTADVLDVEQGAATLSDIGPWKKAAQANFQDGTRPGQREPAIYCSASNVTNVANALVAAGIQHCPLWVAHFGIGVSAAQAMLAASSGPYPIVGVQYANGPQFDSDLFLTSWLQNVSGKKAAVTQAPPGQWIDPKLWTWKDVAIVGLGLDGNLHSFLYDDAKDTWTKVA